MVRPTHLLSIFSLLILLAGAAIAGPLSQTRPSAPPPDDEVLLARKTGRDRSVNHVIAARVRAGDLALVGEERTALYMPAGAVVPIEVIFAGAAEWVSEIEISGSATVAFTIDLLRPDGQWVADVATIESILVDPEPIDVPVGQYQGLRIRPRGPVSKIEPVAIDYLGAYFFQEENTRDNKETADEWCEDYPGNNNDLTSPNETAQRMSDYLDGHGWTWLFDYGNSSAWEEDFKRADLGGTNGSYVDATDSFIYCGHGSDDVLSIARQDRDDPTVTAADIRGAYDGDLEWGWFHCCLNMKTTAWAGALANCHTLAGWVNVINGSKNWGKTIAQKLIDNGIFDSSWSIYSSWWHSNDTNQPAGNQARLLAEDWDHYNERIWGEGTTEPDSDDNTHYSLTHTVAKTASVPGARPEIFYGRADPYKSAPIKWEIPASLGELGQPALQVFVRPEVLQKQFRETMPVWAVRPADVSPGSVASRFGQICEVLQLDCSNLEAGDEDDRAVAASSGLATLSEYHASGGLMFTNQALHRVPTERPNQMIPPGVAAETAWSFLQASGLMNQDMFIADVRPLEAAVLEGTDIVQSWPFAYDVVIGRMIGIPGEQNYPAIGLGERTHVCVGPGGGIQAFNQVHREIVPQDPVQTISIQAVLDNLMAFGYNVLQAQPEFIADQVVVEDANLGYFGAGIDEEMNRMSPHFYLDVTLVQDGQEPVTAAARIYMAADAEPMRAEILSPQDGASVPAGELVEFAGRVVGGAPPYQVQWFAEPLGLISEQAEFTTDQLVAIVREMGSPEPVTVEFRARDSLGRVASDVISINLTGFTGVDEPPAAFAMAPAHPNPFNPRTTLSFSLPAAARVRLRIFDLRGRQVRTLVEGDLPAGLHSRVWDGTNEAGRPASSGVYLSRLEMQGRNGLQILEQKLTLLK